VDEVEVEVVEAEVAERGATRPLHVRRRVRVVPQLGRDEERRAIDVVGRVAQREPDLALVAVDGGAVDVAVAAAERLEHRAARHPLGRLPRAHAELRHRVAAAELDERRAGHRCSDARRFVTLCSSSLSSNSSLTTHSHESLLCGRLTLANNSRSTAGTRSCGGRQR
jgi:hypothetical protein